MLRRRDNSVAAGFISNANIRSRGGNSLECFLYDRDFRAVVQLWIEVGQNKVARSNFLDWLSRSYRPSTRACRLQSKREPRKGPSKC